MKTDKPKPTYTDEQLEDIKEQIIEDREREHLAIAGDQAYRLAAFYVAQDVNRGLADEELFRVIKDEWKRFNKENPVLGKKPLPPAPEKK